jgi:uncharacterized protein
MSSPQHEPTMEEILASIRKIISEDAPESAAAAPPPAASPPPEAARQELLSQPAAPDIEVLELTQEVFEPAPVRPEPATMPEPAKADDIMFEPASAPASEEGIFSDRTRKAMDETFASLDHDREPAPASRVHAPAPIPPLPGSSVESVFERAVRESFEPVLEKYLSDNSAAVLDRMKPLIREWMDEHFPALLEGAVRNEIERVVRARGRH